MTQSLLYPDSGGDLEDRSVLRNAVVFSTAQRASRGARVLTELMKPATPLQRAFLAVDAFDLLVVSLEDLIGWLFVLKDWRPGTPDGALFASLDTVRVGNGRWSEDEALNLVKSLDDEAFRKLVHLPPSRELIGAGWSLEEVQTVERALKAQREGCIRAIERRADKDRAMVRAYNKSKHMLLGILRGNGAKYEVALLTSETGYKNLQDGLILGGTILTCGEYDIAQHVRDALQVQSVLNCLLTLILWVRFGEGITSAEWVIAAYNMHGWFEADAE